MKRILAMCLILLLLTGCARKEPAPIRPEAETAPPVEKVEIPVAAPEPAPTPALVPEATPEPVPELELTPEPVPELEPTPEPEPDWCALVQETYVSVTDREQFCMRILEHDGDWTDLTIVRGENDWNVAGRESGFQGFQWSPATAADWTSLDNTDGNLLVLMADEGNCISCRSGSDVVQVIRNGETFYLLAVNPREGEPFEWKVYGLLEDIAEDAMAYQAWYITADGSLCPEEAAWELACQMAENHRNVPEWVDWGVVDMQAAEAEIFDLYRGYPEQFCCDMSWRLQLPDAPEDVYWVAGAGASEPDENNWRTYSGQVLVARNENGDWAVLDRGTGGYTVRPEWPAEKPWVDWLVELFCLTEGLTHDSIAPHQILSLPPDQMEKLPAVLEQLTAVEARDLCEALGRNLRKQDYSYYTAETLKPLLGDYGVYLDA